MGEKIPLEKMTQRKESKETAPKPMKVGISIAASWGGWGDIEHGLKIAERLRELPNFQVEVYTPDFATDVINRVSPDLPVVPYKRRPKAYGEFHYLGDKVVPEDVMISVCSSPTPSQDELPGPRVSIQEFGVRATKADLAKKQFWITTGFFFDPEKKGTIQAGIPLSKRYDGILKKNAEDRSQLLQSLERNISEQMGKSAELENQCLGLYYVSTLEAKDVYFDLLQLALPQISKPVTIITPFSSDKPELVRKFEEDMERRGFNYISRDISCEKGSAVTIINPDMLPHETFMEAQAVADLPMVVTGDQSLSEAVQKSLSETPSPFFYYCTFVDKEEDFISFIDKIDPEIASLLASYYLQALPENRYRKGDALREKYSGRLSSKEEMARLFYDDVLIGKFNATMKQIPRQMMRDREGHVDNPEDLLEVGKALGKILEALRNKDTEKLEGFLVK